MKKINKIMMPLLGISTAIAVLAPITSCNNGQKETYSIIPENLLKFDSSSGDKALVGFIDETKDLSQYNTLQVPNDVYTVHSFKYSSTRKALECIVNIIPGTDTVWDGVSVNGIVGLPNLKKFVFPKKLRQLSWNMLSNCPKLAVLDFTNVEDAQSAVLDDGATNFANGCAASGEIIITSEQAKLSGWQAWLQKQDDLKNWKITTK